MASSPAWFSSGSSNRGYQILREREFGVGVIAGAGAMLFMGASAQDAVQFAGIAALANSLGDAVAKAANLRTKIEAYEYTSTYIDVADVATGTVAAAGLFYFLGQSGNELMMSAGIVAVSAGIGGKVSTYIGDMLNPKEAAASPAAAAAASQL